MADDQRIDELKKAYFPLSCSIFGLALLNTSVLIFKLGGFKVFRSLDSIALQMILSYLSIFLLRFIFLLLDFIYSHWELQNDNPWQAVILPAGLDTSEIIIWITLSLFIFKMQSMKNKIEAETPKIYSKKEGRNRVYRYVTIIFLSIYLIAIVILDIVFPGAGNDITRDPLPE
jgi:hypothetical protein